MMGTMETTPLHIDERGWWTHLSAPDTEPEQREERTAQLIQLLDALAPICQPLALEISTCWRDLDTGLAALDPWPEPPLHVVVRADARDLAHASTVAEPPAPRELESFAIPSLLAVVGAEQREGHVLDWMGIRSTTVAVRSISPRPALKLEEISEPIHPWRPEWFVGPVAARGSASRPPVDIRFDTEASTTARVGVHWAPWCHWQMPERSQIERALAGLSDQGWTLATP